MPADYLFDDFFTVKGFDPDGKKFDKVSRVVGESDSGMYMQLDVAIEVFPMRKGDHFKMVLASTLNLDGAPDTGFFTQASEETLADRFDYVMQGKLYRIANYVPPPPPSPKKMETPPRKMETPPRKKKKKMQKPPPKKMKTPIEMMAPPMMSSLMKILNWRFLHHSVVS